MNARERLRKILERVDETRDSARPYFVDQEFAEAARALLAEPPAGDAALLRELTERVEVMGSDGDPNYASGYAACRDRVLDEIDVLLTRAATPAAAEPLDVEGIRSEVDTALDEWDDGVSDFTDRGLVHGCLQEVQRLLDPHVAGCDAPPVGKLLGYPAAAEPEPALPPAELRACPFCGSAARFAENSDESDPMHGAHWIECSSPACAATTNAMFACKEDCRPMLRDKWNRRAAPQGDPAPAEREDAIRAVLADLNKILDAREPADRAGDPREFEETVLDRAVALMRSAPAEREALLREFRDWFLHDMAAEESAHAMFRGVQRELDELLTRAALGRSS